MKNWKVAVTHTKLMERISAMKHIFNMNLHLTEKFRESDEFKKKFLKRKAFYCELIKYQELRGNSRL